MALASQSIRSSSVPRSSEAMSRRHSGGRNKRVIGVVLLAGLCVAMAVWAARSRDRGPGAGDQSPAQPVAVGDMTPSTSTLLSPSGPTSVPGDANGGTGATREVSPASALPITMGAQPEAKLAPAARDPLQANPNPGSGATAPSIGGQSPAGAGATPPPPAMNTLQGALAAADRATQQGKPLEARNILNRVLMDPAGTARERADLRQRLSDLNQTLMFGPAQFPGDPFTETYRVVSGDKLNKINRTLGLMTEPSLIARVNKMSNPNALKIGQTLKVVRGPFHAVVSKSAFRMDIYAGATPSPSSVGTSGLPDGAEPGWMYVCSFPVGLGEKGLTPAANFTVKEGSKLVNPHWANPRTGEKFGADDPKNPIGERWMGLEGLDEKSKSFTGYGVHGTIDPGSVGKEMSMGCVRLSAADVEIVYELLTGRVSVVKIVP